MRISYTTVVLTGFKITRKETLKFLKFSCIKRFEQEAVLEVNRLIKQTVGLIFQFSLYLLFAKPVCTLIKKITTEVSDLITSFI